MRLTELLDGLVKIPEKDLKRTEAIDIEGLTLDSRVAKPGGLFIALSGAQQHGMTFAETAVSNGACVVLFDPANGGDRLAEKVRAIPLIPVKDLGSKLGNIAARFYGDPSRQLDVIGITGTNGKTSCSQFLGQVLDDCGIIGTLGWGEWDKLNKTINTTPDALLLQQVMADFVSMKKKAVAMEVSSHGLNQGRVNGIHFKGAVYTNISRDHLDYHGTMKEYLAAKLKLLQTPGLEFVVINLDDESYDKIIAAVPKNVVRWGISAKGKQSVCDENISTKEINHSFAGIEFDVEWRGYKQKIKTPLYGDFNGENVLCVTAVMLAMGFSLGDAASKLETIKPVAGRMDRCGSRAGKLSVFVDYAHSPDALNRVLASLRKHCQQELWVVFGCGGNRDAGKRPQMGGIAEQWADRVIVTDDNPRFEDNIAIAKEVMAGCTSDKVILFQDRKQAIQHAIFNAAERDCILIAGKGHETYQEIKGVQYPFNDKEIAEAALQQRFGL